MHLTPPDLPRRGRDYVLDDYNFSSYTYSESFSESYSDSYDDSYKDLLLPEIGPQIKQHEDRTVSKIKRHFKTSPVFLSALIVVYRLLSRSRLMPLEVHSFFL